MISETSLFTIGELAKELKQPKHRIDWLIMSRHLVPAARAGNYRLFDSSTLEALRALLKAHAHSPARS